MTVDELISGLAGLPESLSATFVRRNPVMRNHSDELLNAATDALTQAARKYDANRRTPFRNFATSCIMKRLNWSMASIARRSKLHHSQGFTSDTSCDVADSCQIATVLPDDFYLRLTRHQIRVLCLRFEGGYSFSQIARKCNCSKANVYRIYQRGIRRMTSLCPTSFRRLTLLCFTI